MVSPLKDNRGAVRYFIGARIDVTQLIEGGKTIDSFHQLLAADRPVTPIVDPLENRPTLKALRDLADLLNDEEKGSMRDSDSMRIDSRPSTPRLPHSPTQRRLVGIEERISQDGLLSYYSGQIPGVYQNVRPPDPHYVAQLTAPVHPRSPLSLAPHHLHLTLPPHSRALSIQTRRPHWGSRACEGLARRSTRPRHWGHSKNLLANTRIPTEHAARSPPVRRRREHCHKRYGHDRRQGTVDTLHPAHGLGRESRRHHDYHGGQAGGCAQSAEFEQHV